MTITLFLGMKIGWGGMGLKVLPGQILKGYHHIYDNRD